MVLAIARTTGAIPAYGVVSSDPWTAQLTHLNVQPATTTYNSFSELDTEPVGTAINYYWIMFGSAGAIFDFAASALTLRILEMF